jgi:hypothetical protein
MSLPQPPRNCSSSNELGHPERELQSLYWIGVACRDIEHPLTVNIVLQYMWVNLTVDSGRHTAVNASSTVVLPRIHPTAASYGIIL